MGAQLRFVSKEEAHRMIDDAPGDGIMIIRYKGIFGISDNGRYIRKKRGKKFVDKSTVLVLTEDEPVSVLNLHKNFFTDLSNYEVKDAINSIFIPKLE